MKKLVGIVAVTVVVMTLPRILHPRAYPLICPCCADKVGFMELLRQLQTGVLRCDKCNVEIRHSGSER